MSSHEKSKGEGKSLEQLINSAVKKIGAKRKRHLSLSPSFNRRLHPPLHYAQNEN